MKTKDKIVYAALELFNQQGERNITTNHIAAHIGISPGNLYYHFSNKQEIVREIFALYSNEIIERTTPSDAEIDSVVLLKRHADSLFSLMWKYRFFYANLPEILQRDEVLHERYVALQETTQANLHEIFTRFVNMGVMSIEQNEVDNLVTSFHLIASSWLSYRSAMSFATPITEAVVRQGIIQLIYLLKPHMTPLGLEKLQLLEESIALQEA